jgi:hypothetical protein
MPVASCIYLLIKVRRASGLDRPKLIKDLLLFSGDGGVKGALDQLNCHKEILDLPDAGTTMDADKPNNFNN